MRFDIITIFPAVFTTYLQTSIIGRAQAKRLIKIKIHNLRDFTNDQHKTVDDKPYGGGAGMVLKAEPIIKAVETIRKSISLNKRVKTILFSAKGKLFNQSLARRWAKYDQLIMICGRYEGVDERVRKILRADEISIGPYVLTDGELPAMVVISAVTRLLPGAIKPESLEDESFHSLVRKQLRDEEETEYPHYTRPAVIEYQGKKYRVPAVLLSGNHQEIQRWRSRQRRRLTSKFD